MKKFFNRNNNSYNNSNCLESQNWPMQSRGIMSETEELLKNLEHEDISEKKKAIFAIGEKKINEAVPKLVELLKNDEDKVVRNSAARALGKIADKEQFDEIFGALEVGLEDPDIHVRANSCWALGNLGDPRAIPLLEKMVDPGQRFYTMSADPNSEMISGADASDNMLQEGMKSSDVIIAAVKALGSIGNEAGIPPLKKALKDEEDGAVRCAACIAFGRIKSKEATTALIEALNDKMWYVKRDAAKALMRIKDSRAASALSQKLTDMYDEVKKFAKKALLALDKGAGKTIFKLYLKNPQDKDYQNFIKKNLNKADLVNILTELIEETKDAKQKQVLSAYLKKMTG